MKISFCTVFTFALLLGLSSCETIGLGPKQDSEISFDMVDPDGNAIYPDNLSFKLRQFNSTIPSSSFNTPINQSPDSSWVVRVVNIDPTEFDDLDSLNSYGFNIQFYQKEPNDLLEIDARCACLDYPDAETYMDRFYTATDDLTDRQRVLITYRRTFSIFLTDPAIGAERSMEISASKRIDNTIYIKGTFEVPFENATEAFRMQNGSFLFDIPY